MPQDMKVWRANAKAKLYASLGGCCEVCKTTEKLTIAHKVPLTQEEHLHRVRMGANSRLVLYRKEAKEKKVRLLCQLHNNMEQARHQRKEADVNEVWNPQ